MQRLKQGKLYEARHRFWLGGYTGNTRGPPTVELHKGQVVMCVRESSPSVAGLLLISEWVRPFAFASGITERPWEYFKEIVL